MDNRNTDLNIPFRDFQALGTILGGIAPIAAFFLVAFLFGIQNLVITKIGLSIIAILVASVLGFTLFLYHKEPRHGKKKWFTIVYTSQAILCFLLTHFIVHYTGGAKNSVFSFTCLYIPSVVGYVYGKRGISLIGAVIIMSLSYFANLFSCKDYHLVAENELIRLDKTNIGIGTPVSIEWIYLAIFLLQLYILWEIAVQKEEFKKADQNSNAN